MDFPAILYCVRCVYDHAYHRMPAAHHDPGCLRTDHRMGIPGSQRSHHDYDHAAWDQRHRRADRSGTSGMDETAAFCHLGIGLRPDDRGRRDHVLVDPPEQ